MYIRPAFNCEGLRHVRRQAYEKGEATHVSRSQIMTAKRSMLKLPLTLPHDTCRPSAVGKVTMSFGGGGVFLFAVALTVPDHAPMTPPCAASPYSLRTWNSHSMPEVYDLRQS